jgi:hypothetical protein
LTHRGVREEQDKDNSVRTIHLPPDKSFTDEILHPTITPKTQRIAKIPGKPWHNSNTVSIRNYLTPGVLQDHSRTTPGVLQQKRREKKRREKKNATSVRTRTPRRTPPTILSEYFEWLDREVDHFIESRRKVLEKAYPAVSLEGQASIAKAWIRSNYAKRKSDIPKFMNAWFSRAQNRDGGRPGPSTPSDRYSLEGTSSKIKEAMRNIEAGEELD